MSTALTNRLSFKNVFSYALMRDEKGDEMHKSKGNAIWFDDAADEIGVDAMRWLFCSTNPDVEPQLRAEHHRRGPPPIHPAALELLRFFANYARLDGFDLAA
jgi:isoleucyl-tRNA synthetase